MDILVHTRSTSQGSDRKDPLEAPHLDSLPSNEPKVKHNLFTRFRKDPNCEICKRTKMTRATCRRNSKSHTLRATKFGDIGNVQEAAKARDSTYTAVSEQNGGGRGTTLQSIYWASREVVEENTHAYRERGKATVNSIEEIWEEILMVLPPDVVPMWAQMMRRLLRHHNNKEE